jgi:hypothetical protein
VLPAVDDEKPAKQYRGSACMAFIDLKNIRTCIQLLDRLQFHTELGGRFRLRAKDPPASLPRSVRCMYLRQRS